MYFYYINFGLKGRILIDADSGPIETTADCPSFFESDVRYVLWMYFDAAIVFVTIFSLLFRLALVILCHALKDISEELSKDFSMHDKTLCLAPLYVCIPNCICDEITIQWHIYDVCRTYRIYIMSVSSKFCWIMTLVSTSWLWKYAVFSYLLTKLHWKKF